MLVYSSIMKNCKMCMCAGIEQMIACIVWCCSNHCAKSIDTK